MENKYQKSVRARIAGGVAAMGLAACCMAAPAFAAGVTDSTTTEAGLTGSTDVTVVAPWGNPGQVTYVVAQSSPASAYPRTGDFPAAFPAALLAAAASAAGILALASREE